MAKFRGDVGFGEQTNTNGVVKDVVTERKYRGDILRASRNLESGDKVNFDITVDNSISIVADAYAKEHIFAIRYVRWAGVLWTVTNAELQSPRLILRLGGVYNGPTPRASESP